MYRLPNVYGETESHLVLPQCMYRLANVYEEAKTNADSRDVDSGKNMSKNMSKCLLNKEDFLQLKSNKNVELSLNDLLSRQRILLSRIEEIENELEANKSRSKKDSIQPKHNQDSVDARRNQNSVEPKHNQDSVEPKHNQNSAEPKRNQNSIEPKLNQNSINVDFITRKDAANFSLAEFAAKDVEDNKSHVHDVVINSNVNHSPLSVFVFVALMEANKIKACVKVFYHSSLRISIDSHSKHLNEVLSRHSLNRQKDSSLNRSEYDLIVTLVFKNVNQPNLVVDGMNPTPIAGEANILRFLARMSGKIGSRIGSETGSHLNNLYESVGDDRTLTLIDHFLDQIEDNLITKRDDVSKCLAQFEKTLNGKNFLTGDQMTIADILLWSSLQYNSDKSSFSPVWNKWLNVSKVLSL